MNITTVYNLTDTVIKSHKRPSSTSTSVFIIRSIFEDSACKDLSISTAIEIYNHYMSEIDIANQLWAVFTTLQSQNVCYWKPLFYWLLDIALVNSYLLAKASRSSIIGTSNSCCDHWWFQENLAKILMMYLKLWEHNQIYRSKRIYCAYCHENQLNWQSKHQQWSFRTNITNIESDSESQFQKSRTQWECDQCDVTLCKIEDCWQLWHENQTF